MLVPSLSIYQLREGQAHRVWGRPSGDILSYQDSLSFMTPISGSASASRGRCTCPWGKCGTHWFDEYMNALDHILEMFLQITTESMTLNEIIRWRNVDELEDQTFTLEMPYI